jgi:Co/Zn/Cd efflux system component
VGAAGAVLLDVSPDPALSAKIAARLEQGGDRISDLHLWRVGPGHMAAIVSMFPIIQRLQARIRSAFRRLAGPF